MGGTIAVENSAISTVTRGIIWRRQRWQRVNLIEKMVSVRTVKSQRRDEFSPLFLRCPFGVIIACKRRRRQGRIWLGEGDIGGDGEDCSSTMVDYCWFVCDSILVDHTLLRYVC